MNYLYKYDHDELYTVVHDRLIMNYQSLRSAPAKVDGGSRPQGYFIPVLHPSGSAWIGAHQIPLTMSLQTAIGESFGHFPQQVFISDKSPGSLTNSCGTWYFMLCSCLGHCFLHHFACGRCLVPPEAFLRRAKSSLCNLKTRSCRRFTKWWK